MLPERCKTGVFRGCSNLLTTSFMPLWSAKMVNMVAQQGNYWIANNFIWGWLLIPISALAEVIRSTARKGYKKLRQFNYYFIAAASVLLWAWLQFRMDSVSPLCLRISGNAEEIVCHRHKACALLYRVCGCAIIDNIFIGLGRNRMKMLCQLPLIINPRLLRCFLCSGT